VRAIENLASTGASIGKRKAYRYYFAGNLSSGDFLTPLPSGCERKGGINQR
jgi:hypothetical protein